MRSSYLFTSESVSEGHPDKVADQISDAIVDLFLSKDPEARVACETMTTTNRVVLAGEIRGKGIMDEDGQLGARHPRGDRAGGPRDASSGSAMSRTASTGTASISPTTSTRSRRISRRASMPASNKDEGAGDQGIMFGFACDETPDLMPATLDYSHKILLEMAEDRHSGAAPFLEPDAKSQVTLALRGWQAGQGDRDRRLDPAQARLRPRREASRASRLCEARRRRRHAAELLGNETVYHINPTGSFEIGGPDGDAGMTGRKIIVDTYGGAAPHGGGAFSGKDPTKVDRSAAYAARYLAKNIVAAGLAHALHDPARLCDRRVSEPLSLYVDTHGTGTSATMRSRRRSAASTSSARLTPRGIRTHLGLNKPIYEADRGLRPFRPQSRDGDLFPWERLDLVEDLKAAVGARAPAGRGLKLAVR